MVVVKGLSELQKTILKMAYQNKRTYGHSPVKKTVHLTHGEIQEKYFGITTGTYPNSSKASISRSCTRLWERGLIDCFFGKHSRWAGIKLTEAGEEAAKNLTVN